MAASTRRQFKDEIFEQFARIGKAVSSAKRIELLDLLEELQERMKDFPRDRDKAITV